MLTNWRPLPLDLNAAQRRLAEALRCYKDDSGLTLEQLGSATHYSRASWERWLNGKRMITRQGVLSLAAAAGADPAALLALFDLACAADGDAGAGAGADAGTAAGAGIEIGADAGSRRERQIPGTGTGTTIAQLPATVGDFAGRDEQIAHLCAVLTRRPDSPGQVPIAVVTGGGGLGKTSLAIAAAHQVAERFPDGQFFVDLNGMDPATRDPAAVLRGWLTDLGLPAATPPPDTEALAARFRSTLHGKRMLIVADNAKDVAQLMPLLPGGGGCAVLVTSRDRLSVLPGCVRLDLGPLSEFEALSMLEEMIGAERIRAEPQAVADVLQACAGLPLALRIAGARLRSRPAWPVAKLAERLGDQRRRLDELRIGDLAARTSFEVGFRSLPPSAAGLAPSRLFSLLGLVTGPDIAADAAAALAGVTEAVAEKALEALVDAHLIQSPRPGRYCFHDLLRDFAADRARSQLAEDEQSEAVARLVHWYSRAASAAADHLLHRTWNRSLTLIPPSGPLPDFTDRGAAWAWFVDERANLTAAVHLADAVLPGPEAWVLAVQINIHLSQGQQWSDLADALTVGLRCAQRNADPVAIGQVAALLGFTLGRLDRLEEALEVGRLGIEACEQTSEPKLLASAYSGYGSALVAADRLDEATAVQRKAVDVLRTIGELPQLASGLINLGDILIRRGLHAEGDSCLDEAVRHAREADNAYLLAFALNELGFSQREQHRDRKAALLLTEAAALRGTIDDDAGRAASLLALSSVLLRLGEEQARQSWTQAEALADQIDDASLQKLRAEVESEFAAKHV